MVNAMKDGTKDKTTGPQTRKARNLKPRLAKPGDRIYSLGYVIGGIGRNRLPQPKDPRSDSSDSDKGK